MRAASDHRI